MPTGKEQFIGVNVEFYANQTIAAIYPQCDRLKTIWMSSFTFSREEPLKSGASTCTLTVLQGADNSFGLYHGYFHKKDEMRKYSGYSPQEIAETETLEDFLNAWNKSRASTTVAAYLFSAGPGSSSGEPTDYRQAAIAIVREKTGLPDDKIFVRWNDYEEGETDVVVDPQTQTIKVNMHFWE